MAVTSRDRKFLNPAPLDSDQPRGATTASHRAMNANKSSAGLDQAAAPPKRPGLFPPARWLADYRASWLGPDIVAGATLAAYAIPVSLAYATLAGLPPQIGIYGYMLGGIGYALLGSSRQLTVSPTSAISLMIAATVGTLSGGDAAKYAEIASLAACAVALLCLIAWLFKL